MDHITQFAYRVTAIKQIKSKSGRGPIGFFIIYGFAVMNRDTTNPIILFTNSFYDRVLLRRRQLQHGIVHTIGN